MRAALIYQRATSEADQMIADRLSTLVTGHTDAAAMTTELGEHGPDRRAGAGVMAGNWPPVCGPCDHQQ